MRTQSQRPYIWRRSPSLGADMVLGYHGTNNDVCSLILLQVRFDLQVIPVPVRFGMKWIMNTFGFQYCLGFWTTDNSLWTYTTISIVQKNKLSIRRVREFALVHIFEIWTQPGLVSEPMFFSPCPISCYLLATLRSSTLLCLLSSPCSWRLS